MSVTERKVRVPFPDPDTLVDGIEMDIDEAQERWSEFTFPDGTVMRIKVSLASVTRVDGAYDGDGNPVYITKMIPMMTLKHVPDSLKKRP